MRLDHDWFPADLPANVALGEGSWLYSAYAFLHFRSGRPRAVVIGRDSGVYHGTFFELGPDAEVEIGAFCTIVGATFRTDRRIVVGDYSFVAHEVTFADEPAPAPPRPGEPSGRSPEVSIVLGGNCWIGARAILLPGARIGEGSIVGAGAVIDFEVPPFSLAAGNPGRVIGPLRKA